MKHRGTKAQRHSARSNIFFRALCLCAFVSLCFLALHADTLTGEAKGSVIDVESRNALQDVSMTLVNVARGWNKKGTTDSAGNYVFVQLEPGNYTVVAEKENYYRAERTDILVRLNQPKVVIPAFELRRLVTTPTSQITVTQGELTKNVIVDLTTPTQNILAYLSEPGFTSMVSLSDSSLRANFDLSLVQTLPLRGGRSFDQLSFLSPGVFRVPLSSGEGPAVGVGVGGPGQFSVNGLRSRSNNFTVDGSDNNDEDIGVRRQGFVALVPQSAESVQEFQIMTGAFPAEFGRNAGSMVNAVSRSGQKETHGSIYAFVNPEAWNARNPFDIPFADTVNTGTLNGGRFESSDYLQTQIGAVAGGAIRAEKLFYFGSFERQTTRGFAMRSFAVPSAQERGLRTRNNGFVPIGELGDFFDERGIDYSDAVGKAIYSLYPLPNHPGGPFGGNTYAQVVRHTADGETASGKIDWYLSSVHSFAARYNITDDDSVIPFTGDAINSSVATATRTQNVSLFLNSTSPGFANGFRFSYGRTRLRFPPEKGSPLLFGSTGNNPVIETRYGRFGPFGLTGPIGQLSILPYSTIGVDVFNFPQGRVDNTFQAGNQASWTRERHTFKAGGEVRRSQLNSFSDRNSRPLVQFGNGIVADTCVPASCVFATADGLLRGTDLAALGAPAGYLQTLATNPSADTTIGLRFTQYNAFAQDDWKVRSNLTLNFGLRYEFNTVPTEVNRRIENTFDLRPEQFGHMQPVGVSAQNAAIIRAGNRAFDAALAQLGTFLEGREKIYAGDRMNFAPRVGIVWDPRGDGRTAVRGGYSLSYDAHLGAVTSQSRNVFPSFVPLNLDQNFLQGSGRQLNSPSFLNFSPTSQPIIRPGTLNTYNLTGDAFATGLGTLFAQGPASPFLDLSSNGLAFTLPTREFETGYAQHFVASIERQFGNYMVSATGVATRGLHLPRFSTPNAGLIATPVLLAGPATPLRVMDFPPGVPLTESDRRFGDLGAFTLFENTARSNFSSLQLGVERRLGSGYQFRGNWTWSHAIDDVSDPFEGRGFFSLPQNSSRPDLERAAASFDVRHRVSGFFVWRAPDTMRIRLLRNWTLAVIGEFQTGQPFTVNTSHDRNGDGNLTDRLNSTAGLSLDPGSAHSILLPSGPGAAGNLIAPLNTDGAITRNSFRSQGIATVDVALSRTFVLKTTRLDLRVESFNLLNRTHFGIPVRILESPAFGRSFDTQINPRSVRLSVKMSF